MEFHIVSKGFFSRGGQPLARLDPEFAERRVYEAEQKLAALDGTLLGPLAKTYDGPALNSSTFPPQLAVKYVAIDSVDTEDGLTYAEEMQYEGLPSRAEYIVESGDVLVSNVRPNRGAVSLVSQRLGGSIASSGFTLIRTANPDALAPEYVFAFLKSPFGRMQLIRRSRGSMYPAVLDGDVRDIFIPKPPLVVAKKISAAIAESRSKHDEFFEMHQQQSADLNDLLMSELGEAPPDPQSAGAEGTSHSVRKRSEFFGDQSAERFDAEFFRKEFDEFFAKLAETSNQGVGEMFTASTGRSLGGGTEDVPYIKQSALTNVGINWGAVYTEQGSTSPPRGRVKTGDILLACTAHEIYYVGRKVDYVRGVPPAIKDTNIAVADLMILRPTEQSLDGAYVAAFLRSPWGLHQVQRCIRGLRGGHVYPEDVERFVRVHVPDSAWLKHFSGVAAKAEQTRNEAKRSFHVAEKVLHEWLTPLGIEPPLLTS